MNGKGKIPKNRFQAIAKKYSLYLAIAGVAVSFIFSLENYAFEKGMVNFNVMDTYIYAVEMSGKMIAYAFCASAFAAVFCEDLENKYLRYSIGRGNLKKYVLSKVIVIYVSSIITMILGTLLFIIYLRLQLPWTSDLATSSISGMYHAIRVGRQKWGLGQIGGIFFRSLIMVLITIACTILVLLPKVEWSNEWGKLLRTAATTNALSEYQSSVLIYYDIFSEYTPIELILLEILLCTLICTFVGVLMFLFSLYINKIIAIALFPVLNMHPLICYKLARFVPTVWAELARIATVDHTYYWLPSLSYMVVFLLVGITIMTGLIMHKIRYMQFNWENEDI